MSLQPILVGEALAYTIGPWPKGHCSRRQATYELPGCWFIPTAVFILFLACSLARARSRAGASASQRRCASLPASG